MKKDILQTIKEYTEIRVEKAKEVLPQNIVEELSRESNSGRGKFYNALSRTGVSMICEVKKASPSKGVIDEEFDYMQILSDYEKGGADALSVLTEPKFFLGGNHIFAEIRQSTDLPMLRKDFIVDEYQIYESKALGADAILLICAMLDREVLQRFYLKAKELKLDVLVETHSDEEVQTALSIGADIIGVNSRNLKTFEVSIENGLTLIKKLSNSGFEDKIFVLESGIVDCSDIENIAENGGEAGLIGETLMRAEDRVALLKSFIKAGVKQSEN